MPSSLQSIDGALRLGANVTSGRCDVITQGIYWLTFYRVRLRHERLGHRHSSVCSEFVVFSTDLEVESDGADLNRSSNTIVAGYNIGILELWNLYALAVSFTCLRTYARITAVGLREFNSVHPCACDHVPAKLKPIIGPIVFQCVERREASEREFPSCPKLVGFDGIDTVKREGCVSLSWPESSTWADKSCSCTS